MGKFLRRPLVFILSVVVATVLASIFSTQFVIGDLGKAGAPVGFGDRLSMTAYDIVNLGKLYGIFIFIGLLIAFLAAGLIYWKAQTKRPLIYIVAGMMCFVVMLHLMKLVFFGVPIIAGARSIIGLAFQAIAGGIAGYVFARLTTPKPGAA
ncbi:MAG: hypothetical protein EX271_04415 [Acidimicrobiales bacterium]|nr:hypothetical protein [Hyphomonadaceae bacterium]RZV43166.1 MAG: hypothetical protein EX271_04415 [Acidimicrobiales bacterium]